MIETVSLDGFQTIHTNDRSILFERRIVLGLTQKQVAERANIPLQSYQRFESGDRKLSSASFNMACRVLEALEMDIAGFYHGDYILGEVMRETKDGLRYETGGNLVGVDITDESASENK
ncbi:helix-turn-helix domain-containing protein [Aerococcaceae bacterium NML190073]|nr:helix-turn-helix domain-containing protein [Aerococcaceae bacterium NML190073]